MYSSTYITLLKIIFACFILECTCRPPSDEDLQMFSCLSRIARFFRIDEFFYEDVTIDNFRDEDKMINSKMCAENAIRHLEYPSVFNNVEHSYYKELVKNIKPDAIQTKYEFCGAPNPSCSCVPSPMREAAEECLVDLYYFPNTQMKTLKYALKRYIVIDNNHPKKTEYLNHIIEKMDFRGTLKEPEEYCMVNANKWKPQK